MKLYHLTNVANQTPAFLLVLLLLALSSVVVAQSSVAPVITEITEIKKNPSDEQPENRAEKKAFSFLVGERTKTDTRQTNTSQAVDVSLGLLFILLLIFSMAWFMRKMGYSNHSSQGHLKILATLNLGQKEKIALLQVGKQQLVIGITGSQINTLHVLDEALEPDTNETSMEQGFAHKLSESLSQFKKG